ncbi:MAG: hypothetical protein M1832_000050 [Thelocarpon impressellum]|nr:MAG: hypothetical protein M1832_000050 [Thelocarpon impressellum]
MNPHQKNKIDINSLSEEEQKLFRLYGKLPNKKDLLQNKLKERKYFDSGDYALSKAGKASDVGVTQMGTQHPVPENIPHLTSPGPNNGNVNGNGVAHQPGHGAQGGSPVKESSFLHRETSVDEQDMSEEQKGRLGASVSPPVIKEGVPIRWQS